jgi:hypothetical protein
MIWVDAGLLMAISFAHIFEQGCLMAWDAEYALEGIFLFGAPLNVDRYELDSGQFGQSTETYHVAHFLLDNDDNIKSRLITKMRGPSGYFPVLYLLRRSHLSEQYPEWVREELFYKAWLFSLEPDHRDVTYTLAPWGPGWTLGIGCHKKDNPHTHTTP